MLRDSDDPPDDDMKATPRALLIPEVLRKILLFARHATLHSCIQVSSTFYEIAAPLLYREIRINRKGLSAFSPPEPSRTKNGVSSTQRTTQLELLRYIEVIEIAPHTHGWTAPESYRRAVLDAFGKVETVRMLYQERSFGPCSHLVPGTWGSTIPSTSTCDLLRTMRPSKLVIYPGTSRDAVYPITLRPVLTRLVRIAKKIIIVYPSAFSERSSSRARLVPPDAWGSGWETRAEIFFGGWDNRIRRLLQCKERPNKYATHMLLGDLRWAVRQLTSGAEHPINFYYLGRDKETGKKKKQGERRHLQRVVSESQLRSYYEEKWGDSASKLGAVKFWEEFIAEDHKHEISEDVMMDWAEEEGAKKTIPEAQDQLKRKASPGRARPAKQKRAKKTIPKRHSQLKYKSTHVLARSAEQTHKVELKRDWTRSGQAKRQKI